MKLFPALLAALALLSPGSAAAQMRLATVGDWNLDEGPDACTATREWPFPGRIGGISGNDEGRAKLVFHSPRWSFEPLQPFTATLLIDDQPMEVQAVAFPQGKKDPGRRVGLDVPGPSVVPALAAARTIRVRTGDQAEAFPTTGLAAAANAVVACLRDRKARVESEAAAWAAFDTLGAPATNYSGPGLGSWFKHEDYPVVAAALDQQGTTGVDVLVGTDGRIAGCRVTSSSGYPLLDWQACAVLRRRATYSPARDAAGAPRLSKGSGRILWRLME